VAESASSPGNRERALKWSVAIPGSSFAPAGFAAREVQQIS
jgi:hypothetical protein